MKQAERLKNQQCDKWRKIFHLKWLLCHQRLQPWLKVLPREMVSSNHLWLLNVCFVGPEVGSDLSDAQLLDRAKLLCFCAVGGPLPLPTKPLSDCQAVKRPPISRGNSGFKVPVYSAHAATLQRLVITICSGFLRSFPLGSHSFPFWLSWLGCSPCPCLLDLVFFCPVTTSSGSASAFIHFIFIHSFYFLWGAREGPCCKLQFYFFQKGQDTCQSRVSSTINANLAASLHIGLCV